MTKKSNWYYTEFEEGGAIIDTAIMNRYVCPPFSVVLKDEEAVKEFESYLADPDGEAFDDYLEKNFEMGETYFTEGGSEDFESYEKVKALVEQGVLYDIEKRTFATMEDFYSWNWFWGCPNSRGFVLYEKGHPVEVVELPGEEEPRVFKEMGEEIYYTWKAVGKEEEVLAIEDEDEIELILLPQEEALEEIAKRYGLTMEYGRYSYWDHVPYFVTKDGEKIWTVVSGETKNYGSYIAYQDIPELLEAVRFDQKSLNN